MLQLKVKRDQYANRAQEAILLSFCHGLQGDFDSAHHWAETHDFLADVVNELDLQLRGVSWLSNESA